MEWLGQLFETNRIIVLYVYGQVFFVMGLAVALQSRKRSELALARALPWLAAFGIVHAFVEWGFLFVPIQSGFLPGPLVHLLLLAQLLLRGFSFALLLQFGAELLISTAARPVARGPLGVPWLRLAPSIALCLWAVGAAALALQVEPTFTASLEPWLKAGNIEHALVLAGPIVAIGDVTSRYMLALPATVIVVLGLLRSANALGPLARPPVGSALRMAAAAFAVYAVVGGMVGMRAPFPPASALSASSVLAAIGIPIEVLRSVTGLVIAVAVIRVLDLFEQETDRTLAEARRRELLMRERERIGRDLHDGIIQSIYAVGLHVEEAKATVPADAPSAGRLQTVMAELNRITGDIRAYIFDLRTASLEVLDAEQIVTAVAEELRANTLIELDLRVEGDYRPRLTSEQAEQLRHIAREAFSNVLRHADAHRVEVVLRCGAQQLTLDIRDDGVGYESDAVAAGHGGGRRQGLVNMRRRAELLGASFSARSAPGQGTALSLTMPVSSTRRGSTP